MHELFKNIFHIFLLLQEIHKKLLTSSILDHIISPSQIGCEIASKGGEIFGSGRRPMSKKKGVRGELAKHWRTSEMGDYLYEKL